MSESRLPIIQLQTHPFKTRNRSGKGGSGWTRSGCLTCKSRRKRCDEAKPSCRNCARLGLTCEGYGSIWTKPLDPSAQVFQRPRSSRRRRFSASPSPSPSPSATACSEGPLETSHSPSLTLPEGFYLSSASRPDAYYYCSSVGSDSPKSTDSAMIERTISNTSSSRNALILSPSSPSRYPSHLSAFETYYLQYHMEQGSKLLANLESDENPLRELLIPRAISSPLLLHALCAVSAMHLANRTQDSGRIQTAAASYYVRTLQGVRTALTDSLFSEEAILAVALLCKYEVIRGSVKQWGVHLDALQKLVVSRGGFGSLDRETAEFLRGLLIYTQKLAKITNRDKMGVIIACADDIGLTKLDIYVGYTEEIIEICARIADLSLLQRDLIALSSEVYRIDDALRNWTHTAKPYIIPKGITRATLTRLQMVADCFRDAAYIYLHSILDRMGKKADSPQKKNNNLSRLSSLVSVCKSEALRRVFARVESTPLDTYCEYSALTFPLFIAGCECESPAEQDLVVRSLGSLERDFGVGTVKRAKELLNVLWKEKKQHWLDVLEKLKWELILA